MEKKKVIKEVKEVKTPIGYTWSSGKKEAIYDETKNAEKGCYTKWVLKEGKNEKEYDAKKKMIVFGKSGFEETAKEYEARLKAHRKAISDLNAIYYEKVFIDPNSKEEKAKLDPNAISHYIWESGKKVAVLNKDA